VRVLSQSYEEALKVASAREQKVKEVFDKYDTDNSRTIDTKELLSLLSDLGLTEKLKTDSKVFEKEMMDKYDTNKDGVLRCGQLLFFWRPRLSSHAAPCTHTHTRAALTRGWCDAIDVAQLRGIQESLQCGHRRLQREACGAEREAGHPGSRLQGAGQ